MSKLFTEEQVKFIATRFARESRIKGDISSNDTITHFDEWFNPSKWGETYNRKDLFTIDVIVAERLRAMDIADQFRAKYTKESKEKLGWPQVIAKENSEVSRYITNAISGRTGLNIDEPITEMVLKELKLI